MIIFECGNGTVPQITGSILQPLLLPGVIFNAGGFKCFITQVTGSNGTFTGKCDVIVPFYAFARVPHSFENIKINNALEMMAGILKAEIDPNNPIMEQLEVVYTDENAVPDVTPDTEIPENEAFVGDTTIVIDGVISAITVDPVTGNIIVTTTDGDTEIIELDEDDETAVVTDSNGNQYNVANGTAVLANGGNAATGGGNGSTNSLDSMRALLPDIRFIPAEGQKYGFDSLVYQQLSQSYELADVRGDQKRIPWKAVQTGVTEPVDAVIPESDSFNVASIGFKTMTSTFGASPTGTGNNRNVSIVSSTPGNYETLTAFYNLEDTSGNTTEEELGKLNVIAYDKVIRNVYIVPVNMTLSPADFNEIKNKLNNTYSQAVAEWSVTLHNRFNIVQEDWDVHPENGIFEADDADNRMDYTREQKKIYKAFKNGASPDHNAYYVFVLPFETNNQGIKGYSIFEKQWVYIYKENLRGESLSHTIAHELGHAAFTLRHTFSSENTYHLTQGATDNLMDYSTNPGTKLNKYQWDFIHDPETVWFTWLQDEEEGESADNSASIKEMLDLISEAYRNGEKDLDFTKYGANVRYGNSIKLDDNTKYEVVIVTKLKSSKNVVDPINYGIGSKDYAMSREGDFTTIEFYSVFDKTIEIIVENKNYDVFKDYIFGIKGPLRKNEYRGYSMGVWKPASATYGCDREDDSYDCNEDGIMGDRPHHGVDLKASTGDDCFPIENGKVTYVGELTGYGNCVTILCTLKNNLTGEMQQLYTFYAHLSQTNVSNGQNVKKGDVIGKVGISGANFLENYPNEVHLHFEIMDTWWPSGFEGRKDPANYIDIDAAQP